MAGKAKRPPKKKIDPTAEEAEIVEELPPSGEGPKAAPAHEAEGVDGAEMTDKVEKSARRAGDKNAAGSKPSVKTAKPEGAAPTTAQAPSEEDAPSDPAEGTVSSTADAQSEPAERTSTGTDAGDGLSRFVPVAAACLVAVLAGVLLARLFWPVGETRSEIAALRQEVSELTDALQAEKLDRIAADQEAASNMTSEVAVLAGELGMLSERMDEVERRPIAALTEENGGAAAVQELQDRLGTLEQTLSGMDANVADRLRAAEEAAETATAAETAARLRALLGEAEAGLAAGEPYARALNALEDLTGQMAPDELRALAADGAPTLNALQQRFPQAARDALAVSLRETGGEAFGDRFWAFMRAQTGARSLTAQDGADPDAVLSRAEAALRNGQVAEALAELPDLPGPGQERLGDWISRAQTYLDVNAAFAGYAAQLTGN